MRKKQEMQRRQHEMLLKLQPSNLQLQQTPTVINPEVWIVCGQPRFVLAQILVYA
jgi:hypothetical protein